MKALETLRYLEDRWDDQSARNLDGPDLLRYRFGHRWNPGRRQ